MSINLFLGLHRPFEEKSDIWELETDHFLHNKFFSRDLLLYGSLVLNSLRSCQIKQVQSSQASEVRWVCRGRRAEQFVLLPGSHPIFSSNTRWFEAATRGLNNLTLPPFHLRPDSQLEHDQEFAEYYRTEVLTELEALLDLEHNNVLRTSSPAAGKGVDAPMPYDPDQL